ncbi:interferon-inducible GTPase 5-like [Protopterus annectens]|uniref:interferon-inducible GTPase 5-like n=1 Tax=Protopterus annectens TaxID=7888 RepID=UPI001CFAB6B4|nr:interferon-inducible GTPase 5-like [Protopterus annectens]
MSKALDKSVKTEDDKLLLLRLLLMELVKERNYYLLENDFQLSNSKHKNAKRTGANFPNQWPKWCGAAPGNETIHLQSSRVDIAVTGESGCGKSSLINAILGFAETDKPSAPVDVKETTLEPVPYKHVRFPNVVFWDLPGIGTLNFPASSYFEKINITKFDFFLICGLRFNKNDVLLAKEILRAGKKFFFLRTKIDTDVEYYRRQGRHEETALEVIRKDCRKKIELAGITSFTVFLISSWEAHKYDFGKLHDILRKELPKVKRQAFLLSLSNITCSVIDMKVRLLGKRVWRAALLSCLSCAIPIPMCPVICNAKILADEVKLYYQQLGLDETSLCCLSKRYQRPLSSLQSEIRHQYMSTGNDFANRMQNVAGETQFLTYLVLSSLPVLGSLPSAAISFEITSRMLHQLLDELSEDSKRVLIKALSYQDKEHA